MQKTDFHRLLLDQAGKTQECLAAFESFAQDPDSVKAGRVHVAAGEAGGLRRAVTDALDRSEDAPMSREDIFKLSRAIDGMAGFAKTAAEEMMRFSVPTDGFIRDAAKALCGSGADITAAVRSARSGPRACEEHIIRAKKSGNFVESAHRKALALLLESPNTVTILKTREIYRHLSDAAGCVQEAADIIGDIQVKSI